jgi:hypothetical protein
MKNIICVDLTKYNQSQLSKISDIIGIVDGSLQSSKKEGVKKVFFDKEKNLFIGEIIKETSNYLYSYKGLILTTEYSYLSKKEKENLIKMSGTNFDSKNSVVKVQNTKSESTISVKLEVDAILEKIFNFGINSLTKSEKEFLDKESQK